MVKWSHLRLQEYTRNSISWQLVSHMLLYLRLWHRKLPSKYNNSSLAKPRAQGDKWTLNGQRHSSQPRDNSASVPRAAWHPRGAEASMELLNSLNYKSETKKDSRRSAPEKKKPHQLSQHISTMQDNKEGAAQNICVCFYVYICTYLENLNYPL